MALHLRGTVLPDGTHRDLWLLGDRITFDRPSGEAQTVADGGYLLPGLVDVHTHPGPRPRTNPSSTPRRSPSRSPRTGTRERRRCGSRGCWARSRRVCAKPRTLRA
ncbi:hypothetical protein WKI71_29025 [Streptomyces sp. MS1.AVA.1]|uniref:Amidohydrolase family protein n=1 Tax=Streptomyces machairae TaxID=3134109 RepID=A0ABU8UQ05_9ACTN